MGIPATARNIKLTDAELALLFDEWLRRHLINPAIPPPYKDASGKQDPKYGSECVIYLRELAEDLSINLNP